MNRLIIVYEHYHDYDADAKLKLYMDLYEWARHTLAHTTESMVTAKYQRYYRKHGNIINVKCGKIPALLP